MAPFGHHNPNTIRKKEKFHPSSVSSLAKDRLSIVWLDECQATRVSMVAICLPIFHAVTYEVFNLFSQEVFENGFCCSFSNVPGS